ncbi:MAG: 50S ribosomal protein L6 [Deltaproteobacteria bacterium]|nr:50S ribosomal protein L6 [Deltaproteobacteria bacterium]
MPQKISRTKEIPVSGGVTVTVKGSEVSVKGPKGTSTRAFDHPKLTISKKKDVVIVRCPSSRKKDNALLGTWSAHIKNMIEGVSDGYRYQMKIVYSHFPIKTSIKEDQFIIENFLGEKHPRKAKILGKTSVKIGGDQVVVEGINKEDVGQTAANIEKATKIRKYDPRVFQDGIYLISKEG